MNVSIYSAGTEELHNVCSKVGTGWIRSWKIYCTHWYRNSPELGDVWLATGRPDMATTIVLLYKTCCRLFSVES